MNYIDLGSKLFGCELAFKSTGDVYKDQVRKEAIVRKLTQAFAYQHPTIDDIDKEIDKWIKEEENKKKTVTWCGFRIPWITKEI